MKAYLLVILDDKYEFSKISNSIEENDKRCCKIYNRILNEYLLSDAKEFEEILIGIYNDIEMHKYSFEFSLK